MNTNCKDCSHPLEVCRCTERTVDPNLNRENIIESIEARITTEYMKHHRSLPNDWARIAAGKIFSTHFMILIIAFVMVSCSSQDPCVKMYDWNYTNEWFYRGDERFQVYKTRTGRRFIYDYNIDSTRFRRVYIKTTNESI